MKYIFTVDNAGNANQIGVTSDTHAVVEQATTPAKELRPGTRAELKYDVEQGVHWEYIPIPASERREKAYETLRCIVYGDDLITVDEANHLWEVYEAEGSELAAELTRLIAAAKAVIREQYPDESDEDEEELEPEDDLLPESEDEHDLDPIGEPDIEVEDEPEKNPEEVPDDGEAPEAPEES